jgi:hypothetical protein
LELIDDEEMQSMPPSQVGKPPPPPMRMSFGMMPGKGPSTVATMGAINSGKYPVNYF